ncbi:hypothetical protein B2J93_4308 [Marssonina coronariae]|uniref:Uncharacterized protein n=1 Tax=Diplocarpon coronariae TaxID=2795749 RepID=A0A218YXM9_9HELO|nr:hypothetical protein B2J93_4308 [Marssonina coronariae]
MWGSPSGTHVWSWRDVAGCWLLAAGCGGRGMCTWGGLIVISDEECGAPDPDPDILIEFRRNLGAVHALPGGERHARYRGTGLSGEKEGRRCRGGEGGASGREGFEKKRRRRRKKKKKNGRSSRQPPERRFKGLCM